MSNWWTNGTTTIAEAVPGAAMSVTASVSTDLSTWHRVQFSGVDTGAVPDGGNLLSDELEIEIASGTEFYIRMWKSCSGGITYCGTYGDATNDEKFLVGTTTPDSTGGADFTGNANNFFGGPTAILGMTTRDSVLIIGDSVTYGFNDQYTPSTFGDLGKIAPSIGASLGYIMAGRNSDSAVDFVASSTRRAALGQYASHVIGGFGRNDLDKGRTTEQFQADVETIVGLFDKPVWWDTISPASTSTDGWTTIINQTASATNTRRAPVNTWLRAVPAFLAGVFDTCQVLENDPVTQDSKWVVGYNSDAQHPSAAGYAAVKSSGVISPSVL